MSQRRTPSLACVVLAAALVSSCDGDPPPDNQGIELYVSGEAPIVLDWGPVPEQRKVSGWVHVSVDGQAPAPGSLTLTLNGVALPLLDPDSTFRHDAGAAGLAPLPPGSRITLEARTTDGRSARFTFACPGEVGVRVSPDPIVTGAPVTITWDGPVFLDDSTFAALPDPELAFCNHEPPGAPVPVSCSDYQTLAPRARSTTANLPAYRAGALGFLVQLDVVSAMQQQRFDDLQFHQGVCVLRQRTAFAVAAP